jgi:hypothetical protein
MSVKTVGLAFVSKDQSRVMKTLVAYLPIILIAFLALSCDEKDCCVGREKEGTNQLCGSWLLFERGYSPGTEYIINPVSPVPPQIIQFKSNGELSSSVSGWEEYEFYFVRDNFVGLFKNDPGPSPDSLAFTNSYLIQFEDGVLKLWYRYCIEGCHLGFKMVE